MAGALNLRSKELGKRIHAGEKGQMCTLGEQVSILRKSKSSRMERLGIKCCNYNLHHLAHVLRFEIERRSIRPVPHPTSLVTKRTFPVAHRRQLRTHTTIPRRAMALEIGNISQGREWRTYIYIVHTYYRP